MRFALLLAVPAIILLGMACASMADDKPPADGAGLTPTYLRCESLVDPLGIDVRAPRLSWIVESPARGQKQTAYRVLVADDRADQRADVVLVGRVREIGLQAPRAPVLVLEGRHRGLRGIEHLAQQVGHRASRAFVGQQTQDVGRAVGRQAFEHSARL